MDKPKTKQISLDDLEAELEETLEDRFIKTIISTPPGNHIYFERETGFRNGPPLHQKEAMLIGNGIHATHIFGRCSTNDGTPATHTIPPLQEGGIVLSKECKDFLHRGHDHELPFEWQIEATQNSLLETINNSVVRQSRTGLYLISLDRAISDDHRHRICYRCKRTLSYFDYRRQIKEMPEEQIEKIWESPHVELYCCTCYRKLLITGLQTKKQERLIKRAKRICEDLGFGDEYDFEYE